MFYLNLNLKPQTNKVYYNFFLKSSLEFVQILNENIFKESKFLKEQIIFVIWKKIKEQKFFVFSFCFFLFFF